MKQGERTETVRSQAQKRLPPAVHVSLPTIQSPGPALLPGKCGLAKHLAGKGNMFDDHLASALEAKQLPLLRHRHVLPSFSTAQEQMSCTGLGRA